MIATLIHILTVIRRAAQRLGHGFVQLADAFDEAQRMRRIMHERFWYIEE